MKPYIVPIIVLSIAIGLGIATAQAQGAITQDAPSTSLNSQTPDWRPHHPHFKDLDTNHDGFIDKSEAQGGIAKHFDAIDTDRDGKLSKDELKLWHQAHMKPNPDMNAPAPKP